MTGTTTVDLVRAAKTPHEGMLAIAAALDQIESQLAKLAVDDSRGEWGEWGAATEAPPPTIGMHGERRPRTEVTGDAEHTEVRLVPPTEERKELRRQFERQQLHLVDHLGEGEDWTEVYATGGPAWLYHGNRELVMSYPPQVKATMVEDLAVDNPEEAHEIARDILKAAGETGPGGSGMFMAAGDIG